MPAQLARIEALLFVHGEPIGLADIVSTLGIEKGEAEELLAALAAELAREERGLMLLSHGNRYQLVTKPAVADVLTQFVKRELDKDLSPASLETLAIIAYLGPISKARIEYFRGVNSSVILRNLGIRGLVSRIPDPARQSAWLYEASFELLKHLGIAKREELPAFANFRDRFEAREAANPDGATAAMPAADAAQP